MKRHTVWIRTGISPDNNLMTCRGAVVEIKVEAETPEQAMMKVADRLQLLLGDPDDKIN